MKINVSTGRKPALVEMNLFLEKSYQNPDVVTLRGVDGNGIVWVIADISEKGIALAININKDSGWPLDEHGRLLLVDYDISAEDYE